MHYLLFYEKASDHAARSVPFQAVHLAYVRAAAAHDICARVRYAGESVRKAAEAVIDKEIPAAGGDGGAIALGSDGTVAFPFNTEGMYRGWIGSDGEPHIAIYREDPLPLPR